MRAGAIAWGRGAATVAASHPRHVVLLAAVAGLLCGPLPRGAVLATALLAGALALAAGAAALPGGIRVARPAVTALPGGIDEARPGVTALPSELHAPPGRGMALALAAAMAVLVGGAVADLRLAATDGARLVGLTGRPLSGRAIVLEPVRERGGGPAVARVRLSGGPAAGDTAVMRARPEVRAGTWPGVGEVIMLSGRVAPLGRYDAYQRARGASAAIEVFALRRTGERRGGLAGAVDAARRRAERGLDRGLRPADAALMRGMVLGQDEGLEAEVRTDFQRSGLAHLLAASGQNVMLLATLVLALGAVAGLPLRARLLAALLLVALYVPLAGGGPSIQRAGVMGAAGLVAALAGRPSSRWYAVGLAAAATLALNPRAASDPAWQLSFAAVLALIALAPSLRSALGRRLPGPVAEAAAITIAATIGTAPLLALYFEQVSLASLAANLLAAPAVAPIMWLGMLAAVAGQVSAPLAAPLTALAGPLLAAVAQLAHAAGDAPLAVLPVRLGSPATLALVCLAAIALAACARALWRRRPPPVARRRMRPRLLVVGVVVFPAILVLAAQGGEPPRIVPGELVVSFLDVGQGDATLLQRDGVSILVDTGPPGGPIVRRVRDAGVRRLDLLILTHAELDHEGNALAVLRAFSPRMLLDGGAGWPTPVQRALPAAMRAAGTRALAARAGQRIDLAGLRFTVLWPPAPPPGWRPDGNPNDRAVVALVRLGTFDLLLPADAESNVTAALDLQAVDALKVAHHGSADPGLPALLERLRPAVAAIEVGDDNTYGHPTPSTLAALRMVPRLVRTDRDGTVRLHVSGGAMRLERVG